MVYLSPCVENWHQSCKKVNGWTLNWIDCLGIGFGYSNLYVATAKCSSPLHTTISQLLIKIFVAKF
jgi:hypothetical protein